MYALVSRREEIFSDVVLNRDKQAKLVILERPSQVPFAKVSLSCWEYKFHCTNPCHVVVWRILWFYICGVIVIGMLVSPNNPSLTALSGSKKNTAAASPFVIAFTNVGIQVSYLSRPSRIHLQLNHRLLPEITLYHQCITPRLYALGFK